jgi:molybdopterin converting factor small subunit
MVQALVTVEFFGMPRVIAGTDRATVDADTLGQVLRQTLQQYPPLAEHVLNRETGWLNGGYTFVVDGRFTSDPMTSVYPESEVLLVARASGGAI